MTMTVMKAAKSKFNAGEFFRKYTMVIALVGRLLCSILSGVVVWGTPLWGSITYNVSYMLPEMVICLLLGMLIGPRIVRMMQQK